MPQSLSQNYVHLVFSTKDRKSFLQDTELQKRVHAYVAGTCKNLDSPAIIVGGIADHVHILLQLARTKALSDVVRDIKRESTKWIREEAPRLSEFHWQSGYGAFSVSHSLVDTVAHYIRNQAEHHQKMSFQDEFRKLLKKSGLQWDERYVWD
ncbi:IS200/IS605 family transposase [Verrucomicrobium sp. BvORR034]|uniref:IS200/IS605 family transposase n=1 Tax=Verrucomicrobium sp. BvORR034 TaxID=1396418 RepID=UPI000679739B|nr:IS200/IS605 family transposase [Verrucomicrobium sp. BvORR034]